MATEKFSLKYEECNRYLPLADRNFDLSILIWKEEVQWIPIKVLLFFSDKSVGRLLEELVIEQYKKEAQTPLLTRFSLLRSYNSFLPVSALE